jgi:2C-methyl-D-erythritol 2,4-cyclodiphosphate synthase
MEENFKRKKRTYKKTSKENEVELPKNEKKVLEPKKWVFKNVNRKIILGNSVISNYDLENNQRLAEILIEKGLGDLICFE